MINKIRSKGLKVPELIQYKEDENDFSKIATSVNSSGKRCIVVFGKQPSALNMLKEIRKLKSGLRIYASLSVLDEDQIPARDLSNYEGLTIVAPDLAGNSKWKEFSQIFHHKFGYTPGVIAAYSYDAVNIIIEAINLRGTDQTIMQETISEMESEGLTGPLSFDEHGNRKGPFGMIVIANGVPVRVK